jgi:hypothetical protein
MLKHKPGVQVGNDAIAEFHIEKYPPGTAPKEDSYTPNTASELPQDSDAPISSATDTAGGATSADVDQGLGKPLQDQTGVEEGVGTSSTK